MKVRIEKKNKNIYVFNYENGANFLLGNESYRADGPLLLDVSITNRCFRNCSFCYKNANPFGKDISMVDYNRVLQEAKLCGVTQIAIGGGEPTLHPWFVDILKLTREIGIIPNYSTNGCNLTNDIIDATSKYCGAIAVSIYDNINDYKDIITKLSDKKICVNLHVILTKDSLDDYINLISEPPKWFQKLNSIIFLNYKPANGNNDLLLNNAEYSKLHKFFEKICNYNICSIGFDSCTYTFLNEFTDINKAYYDYCESARRSAYINENLDVFPCSFYKGQGISLKQNSLKSIWQNGTTFINHRNVLEKCKTCPLYKIDFGF